MVFEWTRIRHGLKAVSQSGHAFMDPAYVSGRDASVDHINPTDKLDNRACNLRVATNLEQQRNKCKRLHHSQH
jgi:hypothetical protein